MAWRRHGEASRSTTRLPVFRAIVLMIVHARLSSSAVQQVTATRASSLMQRYPLPSGVCTDGSPGFFYMAANDSSNDFVFRMMGGGGCADNATYCEEIRELSAPLFTSEGWPETVAAYNVLSADEADNPFFSTYNRIFVPYCTQDLFLLDTQSPDGELQFRGRPYLEEILGSFLVDSAEGAKVVLVGSSAGGVGAFNVASWLLDSFSQVSDLRVILDSAFFFDIEGTLNSSLDYMQKFPEAAYSTHCSEAFDGGPCCMQFGCMVQRGYYPSQDERLRGTFVISPTQDALPAFIAPEGNTTDEAEDEGVTVTALWGAASYTGQARSLLRNVASLFPTEISVFAPTCVDHNLLVAASPELWMCFPGYDDSDVAEDQILYDEFYCSEEATAGHPSGATYVGTLANVGLRVEATLSAGAWETAKIDGTSMRAAVEEWLADASKQVFLFDSCDDLNCNPTCQSGILPGTREESESLVVCVVVLVTFVLAVTISAAGSAALAWGLLQGNRAHSLVASALRENRGNVQGAGHPRGSLSHVLQRAGTHAEEKPILEWKALNFWLPPKKRIFAQRPRSQAENGVSATRGKQLIRSMHGSVPKGALCALMGPSGGGKTTLLDLLTGRKDYGQCEGEVLFQGVSISSQEEAYMHQSGYMRQANTGYLDSLTVLENLIYAAMIRFPATLEAQSQRVQTAIQQTSLERCAHTKAGALSGGQKRRLKLALELLVDRKIIFLDEPTSGLDASASLELVTILERLSQKVTLIVAIHQPRPEVWQLFSHTILVSGGRTVYCGPADEALAGTARYLVSRLPASLQGPSTTLSPEVSEAWTSPWGPTASHTEPKSTVSAGCAPPPLRESEMASEHDTWSDCDPCSSPPPPPPPHHARTEGGQAADETMKAVQSDRSRRARRVLGMSQWESFEVEDGVQNPLRTSKDAPRQRCAGRASSAATGPRGMREEKPRAVPDKILDRLVMIGKELSGSPQQEEDERKGLSDCQEGRRSDDVFGEPPPSVVRSTSRAASAAPQETIGRIAGGSRMSRSSAVIRGSIGSTGSGERAAGWKVAAVLLARACQGGYAREVLNTVVALVVALIFIGISVRLTKQPGEGLMLHLVVSVLATSMLPVLLVYSPVMIITTYTGWPLTKLEIADGFYTPRCATLRYMIDHLSVGVVVSFSAVSIAHIIFWGDFISALPASAVVVNITLSCAITLSAWVMIALIDGLVVSGLSLGSVCGVANAINTMWGAFSGTIFLVSTLPALMKAVTYSSPHYWATFFGLRVLLDGLDLTDSCDHDSKVYCAASYGDLVAHALDLHIHSTGLGALSLAGLALAGLASLAGMVHFNGRHVRITKDLRQSEDVLGQPSLSTV